MYWFVFNYEDYKAFQIVNFWFFGNSFFPHSKLLTNLLSCMHLHLDSVSEGPFQLSYSILLHLPQKCQPHCHSTGSTVTAFFVALRDLTSTWLHTQETLFLSQCCQQHVRQQADGSVALHALPQGTAELVPFDSLSSYLLIWHGNSSREKLVKFHFLTKEWTRHNLLRTRSLPIL